MPSWRYCRDQERDGASIEQNGMIRIGFAMNGFRLHGARIDGLVAFRKMLTRHRGLARVDWPFTRALAAYDLIRLPKLPRAAT